MPNWRKKYDLADTDMKLRVGLDKGKITKYTAAHQVHASVLMVW